MSMRFNLSDYQPKKKKMWFDLSIHIIIYVYMYIKIYLYRFEIKL